MAMCPFFGLCGGCKYDFSNEKQYRQDKISELSNISFTNEPIWGIAGSRRRAEFTFSDNVFGFYKKASKDVIDINRCNNVVDEINNVLPELSRLPWIGTGSVLITVCENGIDIGVICNIPYYSIEFKKGVDKLSKCIIRFTWNNSIIRQLDVPKIKFNDKVVEYPTGMFLQPTVYTEQVLRDLVVEYSNGFNHIVDLFCGLGNFTFVTKAKGFDIAGNCYQKRDLLKKPLTYQNLKEYDLVIMDPPRAGALAQIQEIAKSDIKRVIYISCNPDTFIRDKSYLENSGYKPIVIIPVDQFIGASHWEIFCVLDK